MPDYQLQIRTEGVLTDKDGNVIEPSNDVIEQNNEEPEPEPETEESN